MTRRPFRLGVFLFSLMGLATLLLWGFAGLPGFGVRRPSYGELLASRTLTDTHAMNAVTAVLYDYRGLDTLGEELILVAAVVGVAALLRTMPRPRPRRRDEHEEIGSEAIRLMEPRALALTALFGAYLAVHGHLTPGGGFQGGGVATAALIGVQLAYGYARLSWSAPKAALDAMEAFGALAFAGIGFATLASSGLFLANVLPLGAPGSLLSSGTVAIINLAAWVAVSGGLAMLVSEFVEEEPQDG